MLKATEELVIKNYNIKENAFKLYKQALNDVQEEFKRLDEIREFNQLKVLTAFQEERISDSHFTNSTGYAYDDLGREGLDKVYARVFNTEAAIVRPHFVNGTHAIGTALFGNLRPGDTLVAMSGQPYDTLHGVIGLNGDKGTGSLID
ncbi:MAG: methionine gamma-lyase family protein, partial [Clostridium baratii]|nr:methionine gamma-lyase family protein [Clostridium baratii]